MFFFFQAEDGIRDYKVTGVQTCALPILFGSSSSLSLFTAQSNSPTLRVPCGTTCFGTISVLPTHVLLGSASQVIFTGSFASSAPSSGSSMKARTRTLIDEPELGALEANE